jgi:cobalt/nickel transport system ATP-binding protein
LPTVYEDIAFGLRNYGLKEEEIVRRIDDVLKQLSICHLRDRLSHKLSGGEKRLAALAGILVMQPSILLLDEPSSFLDPRSRRRLIEILANLSQAMLIASHDLDLAQKLCPRALLLKQGRLIADGPTRELLGDEGLLEEGGL